MSRSLKKSPSASETLLTTEEQQEKINEVRRLVEPLPEKLTTYCSNASISRYLRTRNWNVKKATKMLKDTLKWRLEYKPEEIHWEEVAKEAETGTIYRSNYIDKYGRPVLVMRPSCQNTKTTKGQIKYLVYCLENAVLNLPRGQEKMVWLIDFHGFNMSHISVKVAKDTANVLQNHYPERLGLAILYNPPKIFEPFYTMVKPFLEPKTYQKVKFVYSDDSNANKVMEDLFDMDKLEIAFGGKDTKGFDIDKYAERMREDDNKMLSFWTTNKGNAEISTLLEPALIRTTSPIDSDLELNASDQEKPGKISSHRVESEAASDEDTLATDLNKVVTC